MKTSCLGLKNLLGLTHLNAKGGYAYDSIPIQYQQLFLLNQRPCWLSDLALIKKQRQITGFT